MNARTKRLEPAVSRTAGTPPAGPVPDAGSSRLGVSGSSPPGMPVFGSGSVGGVEGGPKAGELAPPCRGVGTESPRGVAAIERLGEQGPGESNTRGQTPAVQGRALQHGVDSLVLAFAGQVPDFVLARLAQGLGGGATGVAQIDGHSFEVSRVRQSFRCTNADCTLMLGHDQSGFDFVFEARALYLRTHALAEVLATARRLASKVLARPPRLVRVRRLDLFVDVAPAMRRHSSRGRGRAQNFTSPRSPIPGRRLARSKRRASSLRRGTRC